MKIHSSGGLDALHDELGKEILPEEYGGTNSNIEDLSKFWRDEALTQTEWLIQQTRLKTEESLRQGKSKIKLEMSCSLM